MSPRRCLLEFLTSRWATQIDINVKKFKCCQQVLCSGLIIQLCPVVFAEFGFNSYAVKVKVISVPLYV